MKLGSKYYPLFEYLQRCQQATVDLSFRDIEQRLGQALPASARLQRAWWSNRMGDRALQARAWIEAGYHAEVVDLAREQVTFRRFQVQYLTTAPPGSVLWDKTSIRSLRKSMGLTQAKFAQELGVRRQTVSEWETGVYAPDRSTAKHLERILTGLSNANAGTDGRTDQ